MHPHIWCQSKFKVTVTAYPVVRVCCAMASKTTSWKCEQELLRSLRPMKISVFKEPVGQYKGLYKDKCSVFRIFYTSYTYQTGHYNHNRNEVIFIIESGEYMGIWQIHAVASILNIQIKSIFPTYGGATVRQHLNREITPRGRPDSQDKGVIMWTNISGKKENSWSANHFVICVRYKYECCDLLKKNNN